MSKQLEPWIEGRLRPEPLASRLVHNTFFKRAPLYMASCMAAAVKHPYHPYHPYLSVFTAMCHPYRPYALRKWWRIGTQLPPLDIVYVRFNTTLHYCSCARIDQSLRTLMMAHVAGQHERRPLGIVHLVHRCARIDQSLRTLEAAVSAGVYERRRCRDMCSIKRVTSCDPDKL